MSIFNDPLQQQAFNLLNPTSSANNLSLLQQVDAIREQNALDALAQQQKNQEELTRQKRSPREGFINFLDILSDTGLRLQGKNPATYKATQKELLLELEDKKRKREKALEQEEFIKSLGADLSDDMRILAQMYPQVYAAERFRERKPNDSVKPTPDNPLGLSNKERFDRSDKLSDDFRLSSKDFVVARDSMKRILDAANNPSPFGDLSIIFSAMKVLDPNSVVRESEFKTVADAAPLLVRLGFSADKIEAMTAGNKLTDAQRADVVGTVLRFYDSATQSQEALKEFYANKAKNAGLKTEDVIFDYGSTVKPKIQNFQFMVSLQNMTPEQLKTLDTTGFTEKQKEIYLQELKKLSQ